MRTSHGLSFALAVFAFAPSAVAQDATEMPEGPAALESVQSVPPFGNRQSFFQLQTGGREGYITDEGYDPFSTDNTLPQVSVALTRTLWQFGRYSFATGVYWDYGTKNATARGDPSEIDVNRLGLGLEGRYHIMPWLYGLVRLTPGVMRQSVSIDDPAAPGLLKDIDWAFAFDASAGAAVLLGPHGASPRFPLRFWIVTEGGYGWAARKTMTLKPELDEDEVRPVGSLRLGTLALRGGFLRIAAAVTY